MHRVATITFLTATLILFMPTANAGLISLAAKAAREAAEAAQAAKAAELAAREAARESAEAARAAKAAKLAARDADKDHPALKAADHVLEIGDNLSKMGQPSSTNENDDQKQK